jgi:hypothetical protein
MRRLLVSMIATSLVIAISRADSPPPKTSLAQPGKLLLQADFSKEVGPNWTKGPGAWEITDGALRGSERASDMHGAVRRHPLSFHDAVIQYAFKLDGATLTTLSINSAKGHACRVLIRPSGLALQKDKDKKTGAKAVALDTWSQPISVGAWHTLTVEIIGKHMLVSLDGRPAAFGVHDGIDVPFTNFGFTVKGESASFKDLQVWEATANPRWESLKEKVLGERGKK